MTSKHLQILSNAGVILPNDKICPRSKLDTGTLCNYKCYFCYYKTQLNKNTEFNIIKKRIDKLYELGCRDFDLSGGESSLHKDFFKILEYLKSLNVKISCLTNGSKFCNFDFLKKAHDLGLNEILFSLHSINEVHDEIVGIKGSFDKILKAIENAKKLDIKIRLNSTITEKNYKLVNNEYFDLVEKINPFEMNFLPLNYFSDNNKMKGLNYETILEPIKDFIKKTSIKLVNVRYVPFCYMMGFEKYVVGYYQHIYDLYDWNIAYYEYKESNLENLKEQASINRINNYNKDEKCLKCKFFYICDGIEPQAIQNFKPIQGNKIQDVNYFRKNFWNI